MLKPNREQRLVCLERAVNFSGIAAVFFMNTSQRTKLLVVVQWPLGGIRTYMKYVYRHLPKKYHVTILAASTHEDQALRRDATELGARLVTYNGERGKGSLYRAVFSELSRTQYDLMQSQGFISALHASFANMFFRVPHIITVHGILEERYLQGRMARAKSLMLSWVMRNAEAVYAVSEDMKSHLLEHIPLLKDRGERLVVINNGIDTDSLYARDSSRVSLRNELGIGEKVPLIGFMGRFMQQKGFHYLIDAAELLEKETPLLREFKIIAVGSGDYVEWYKKVVRDRNLGHRFLFIPFRQDICSLFKTLDCVVMPSVWEASPLLAMETLCMGTPLIASDCIGLRETVQDTPAFTFESGNATALATAIRVVIEYPQKELFASYSEKARARYDVKKTAVQVDALFTRVLSKRTPAAGGMFLQ